MCSVNIANGRDLTGSSLLDCLMNNNDHSDDDDNIT